MEAAKEQSSDWSGRDQVGCLAVYLLFWIPPTLLMLGFAGTINGLVLGIFKSASSGSLVAIIYLVFSVPAVALPVMLARKLLRDK